MSSSLPEKGSAVARLESIADGLSKVQRAVSATEERLDRILFDAQDLLGALNGSAAIVIARSPRRVRSSADDVLRRAAEKGVADVRLRRRCDSAELRIDGARGFRLTLALADLVEVLIDDKESGEHLVGWKSFDEIETVLAKRSGRPKSRRALKTLIYRLRERLRESGENPYLVQVWKGSGARFALRRQIAPGAEPPVPGSCDDE